MTTNFPHPVLQFPLELPILLATNPGSEEVLNVTQLSYKGDEVPTEEAPRRGGHQRYGACHRCGWPESLRKVTMRRTSGSILNRAEALVRGTAWLCDECASELSADKVAEQVRTTPRVQYPSRSSRDRVVA